MKDDKTIQNQQFGQLSQDAQAQGYDQPSASQQDYPQGMFEAAYTLALLQDQLIPQTLAQAFKIPIQNFPKDSFSQIVLNKFQQQGHNTSSEQELQQHVLEQRKQEPVSYINKESQHSQHQKQEQDLLQQPSQSNPQGSQDLSGIQNFLKQSYYQEGKNKRNEEQNFNKFLNQFDISQFQSLLLPQKPEQPQIQYLGKLQVQGQTNQNQGNHPIFKDLEQKYGRRDGYQQPYTSNTNVTSQTGKQLSSFQDIQQKPNRDIRGNSITFDYTKRLENQIKQLKEQQDVNPNLSRSINNNSITIEDKDYFRDNNTHQSKTQYQNTQTNNSTESTIKTDTQQKDLEGQPHALKRPRLVWTQELHELFKEAVGQLSLDSAMPKAIMQIMKVDGLTRENVASHLQKYRQAVKKRELQDMQLSGVQKKQKVATDSTPTIQQNLRIGQEQEKQNQQFADDDKVVVETAAKTYQLKQASLNDYNQRLTRATVNESQNVKGPSDKGLLEDIYNLSKGINGSKDSDQTQVKKVGNNLQLG